MALTKEELNKRIAELEKLASSLHEIRSNLNKEALDLSRLNVADVDYGTVSNKVSGGSLANLDPITRFAMQ